jgi:hypothetical protein
VRTSQAVAEREPAPRQPRALARAHGNVIELQRSAGNRAVAQMVARLKDPPMGPKTLAQAARDALEQLEKGTMPSLADWHVMRRGLAPADYRRALVALDAYKGKPADKEALFKGLGDADLDLFTGAVPRKPGAKGALDKQVAESTNVARAIVAHKELLALRKKSDPKALRLTDAVIEMLVWGVAERRGKGTLAKEGLIGIEQALHAAQGLLTMSRPAFAAVMLKLALSGGKQEGWSNRRTESVLILKAVAARDARYATDEAAALSEITGFADKIRGGEVKDLVKKTSVRDIGGGSGLQQKYTMSCGPTSIQIVKGEADPVFASDVSGTAKHDLEYANKVGKEQETLLGKAAAPRKLKDRWKALQTKAAGASAADAPKWNALLGWLGGGTPDATKRDAGKALAKAAGFTDAEIADFKKYAAGLAAEPGLSVPDFQARLTAAKLTSITNATYPLKQFTKANRPKDADLEDMWKRLWRGNDILIGVMWTGGGGHYMTLTDVMGDPAKAVSQRKFLLSDPWEGTSEWISGDDLKKGRFGKAGTGYIDDIYY